MPDSPVNRGPLMLFATRSHVAFAEKIAEYLRVPLYGPSSATEDGSRMITEFSNGNVVVTLPDTVRGKDCYIISTQAPPVNRHLMELALLMEGLTNNGAARVNLVTSYLPYSRSDKADRARRVIGLRMLANWWAHLGCTGVLTMDAHPAAPEAYFPSSVVVSVLEAKSMFVRYIREHLDLANVVAVAPDANSGKKMTPLVNALGHHIPMAFIDKRRDGDQEGKARPAAMIGDVRGKRVIVVDDEIMSGGTLIQTAEFCMEQGALEVIPFITHPILSQEGAVQRLQASSAISRLVVTDSVPIPPEKLCSKILVLSVVEMFAEAISRIHTGGSIDKLKRGLMADAQLIPVKSCQQTD